MYSELAYTVDSYNTYFSDDDNILRSMQVGGHFPIVCLDGTTVCKPLNDREHREPAKTI